MKTRLKNKTFSLFFYTSLFLLFLNSSSYAQLEITPATSTDADALVLSLLGTGIDFENATLTTANTAAGTFDKGNMTNIGLDNGVILTTGDAYNAIGPNDLSNKLGVDNMAPGHSSFANSEDATVLQFDFVPSGDFFSFNYVFASDEFDIFVCDFNDAFGFFLTGPNPNGPNYNETNIALLPNGNEVTIDNLGYLSDDPSCNPNFDPNLYIENFSGQTIQYNAFSSVLTAQAAVNPCATYTITLVIVDRRDRVLDSGVFLQKGSFESLNSPQPDYIFVDAAGNPETEFCSDEQVFIDASISPKQGAAWFLAIWQYDIGGYAAGQQVLNWCGKTPTWTYGNAGLINLNSIWEGCYGTSNFQPGYEYRIQLAFTDGCGGWFSKADELFTVIDGPEPDYFYTDGEGNPKTVFCMGEDVYIDGRGSKYEERYFLSIWKYNLGGYLAGEPNLDYSRLEPEWADGEVGLVHLNPIWTNFGDEAYFEPGFEYRVQLALKNDCNGWVSKDDELFTVECCDDFETCFGGFTLHRGEDLGLPTITYTTENVVSTNNPWSESFWYLFSHDNFGSGPYVPVRSGVGPTFEFEAAFGSCYSLTHKVITPCGECCFTQEICVQRGEGLLDNKETGVATDIPCDSLEIEFCQTLAPTNLVCTATEDGANETQLSWDPVPGATAYLVRVIVNDPDCCEAPQEPQQFTQFVVENTIEVGLSADDCFSWQVTALCPLEQFGPPSNKQCSSDCSSNQFSSKWSNDFNNETPDIKIANDQLRVFPNPSSGLINFEITTSSPVQKAAIYIYDINHRLIARVMDFSIHSNRVTGRWEPTNEVDNGLYIIEVQLGHTVISEKVLLLD